MQCPEEIEMALQSLKDVHGLNDGEESPLEKELSHVRIARHWEGQII
jgi:hypothetical protein